MDAGKATISGVFNGSRLLEIPFYQRAYVWGEEQWERFLGDMEFVTASKRPYFLGSIILKQASSGNTWSEVSEVRTVIDGQQRLTTMVIFFKALCAKNGTNNLFERDFVLETGDVALRHGKYDRQDFEKVVSATGCLNPSRAPRPSSLPTTTSSRISTRRRSTGTRSSRTSSSSASTLPRARTSSRYSTPSTRSGAPDDGGAPQELLLQPRERARRSRSAGKTSSSPRLRRGSIGSRRSLPGASSARSSTSSSTRSSRFWSRTRGVASRPRTSSSIRARPTSSSPTKTSSPSTAMGAKMRCWVP